MILLQMILLQISKQISFPHLHHVQKAQQKRNCLAQIGAIQGFIQNSSRAPFAPKQES